MGSKALLALIFDLLLSANLMYTILFLKLALIYGFVDLNVTLGTPPGTPLPTIFLQGAYLSFEVLYILTDFYFYIILNS